MDKFYNDPVQEEILCAHRKSTSYHNLFHKHDGYEIYLLLSGEVNIYIQHSCYQIKRGTLCFFNPDQLHLAKCLENNLYERLTINVKPQITDRLSTENTDLLRCFHQLPSGEHPLGLLTEQQICEYLDLFQKLKASANLKDYGCDVQAYACLAQILLLANQSVQNHVQPSQNVMPELISRIMQYVEEHLSSSLTLDIFAQHFFMNGKYLSRRFREEMGITLQEYIISKRIVYAKHLLCQNYSVTDTCFQAGFGSYSNFIRTFSSQVGISPGQYRKSVQN